jgi:hypothetical protein
MGIPIWEIPMGMQMSIRMRAITPPQSWFYICVELYVKEPIWSKLSQYLTSRGSLPSTSAWFSMTSVQYQMYDGLPLVRELYLWRASCTAILFHYILPLCSSTLVLIKRWLWEAMLSRLSAGDLSASSIYETLIQVISFSQNRNTPTVP